jgi:hypothetical protein
MIHTHLGPPRAQRLPGVDELGKGRVAALHVPKGRDLLLEFGNVLAERLELLFPLKIVVVAAPHALHFF